MVLQILKSILYNIVLKYLNGENDRQKNDHNITNINILLTKEKNECIYINRLKEKENRITKMIYAKRSHDAHWVLLIIVNVDNKIKNISEEKDITRNNGNINNNNISAKLGLFERIPFVITNTKEKNAEAIGAK